jgi:hypothetical protein
MRRRRRRKVGGLRLRRDRPPEELGVLVVVRPDVQNFDGSKAIVKRYNFDRHLGRAFINFYVDPDDVSPEYQAIEDKLLYLRFDFRPQRSHSAELESEPEATNKLENLYTLTEMSQKTPGYIAESRIDPRETIGVVVILPDSHELANANPEPAEAKIAGFHLYYWQPGAGGINRNEHKSWWTIRPSGQPRSGRSSETKIPYTKLP